MSRRKRMLDVQNLLSIIKTVRGENIYFLYKNLNEYSKNLLGECVNNLLYNTGNLRLNPRQLVRVKKKIAPYRKQFEYIARENGSELRRSKAVKQIGGGVFTTLAGILIPTIITLLTKK